MKLGNFISEIEFSERERSRLAKAILEEESLPFNVLHTRYGKISENDFWKRAQKKLGVTGFRIGTPAAKSMVLDRCLYNLRKGSGPGVGDIWPLYKRCAVDYIRSDLINVDRLVLSEEFTEGDGPTTERVFKFIQSRMFYYECKPDDIRKLYEIWGFERVDDFESLLRGVGISGDLVRRLIIGEVENLKRETRAIEKAIRTEQKDQLSLVINGFENLNEKIGSIEIDVGASIAELRLEIPENVAQMIKESPEASEIKPPVDVERPRERRSVDRQVVLLRMELAQLKNVVADLKNIESSKIELSSLQDYEQSKDLKKDATVLLHGLGERLKASGCKNPDSRVVWALLQLIRNSKIIVTDRPKLLMCPYGELADSSIKHIAASPLWTSKSDWSDAHEFICSSGPAARVLIISDFDVAIQEAYLIPGLIEFLCCSSNPANRIILVPSRPDTEEVCERLWEFCSYFAADDDWLGEGESALKMLDPRRNDLVDLDLKDFLKYAENADLNFEKEIMSLSANVGISLPIRLVSLFVSLYIAFSESGSSAFAWHMASRASLFPWIRSKRGESFKAIFEQSFRSIFGGLDA